MEEVAAEALKKLEEEKASGVSRTNASGLFMKRMVWWFNNQRSKSVFVFVIRWIVASQAALVKKKSSKEIFAFTFVCRWQMIDASSVEGRQVDRFYGILDIYIFTEYHLVEKNNLARDRSLRQQQLQVTIRNGIL